MKKIISSRFFGVELESHPVISGNQIVEVISKNSNREIIKTKWKQTSRNDYWHVKTDSTCGGGESKGWEIASFKASGYEDLLEICKVAKALRKSGLRCGEDCGLHVHVDISDFSIEQASVLLAYWVKVEKIVLKSVPAHRSKSSYCKSLCKNIIKNKKWNCVDFWNSYKPKDVSIHGNKDKRVTMNLVNYVMYMEMPFLTQSRSTAEFRFPEGTFNENDIKNWVIFFINFIDNVKNRKMPDNLFCISDLNYLVNVLGIRNESNKKWFFYRVFNFDTKKKWKKIAKNQIGISDNI